MNKEIIKRFKEIWVVTPLVKEFWISFNEVKNILWEKRIQANKERKREISKEKEREKLRQLSFARWKLEPRKIDPNSPTAIRLREQSERMEERRKIKYEKRKVLLKFIEDNPKGTKTEAERATWITMHFIMASNIQFYISPKNIRSKKITNPEARIVSKRMVEIDAEIKFENEKWERLQIQMKNNKY